MKRYGTTPIRKNNLLREMAIIILIIFFLPVCSLGEQMTVDQLYQKIKELENVFPLPILSETIKIGTYDAKTGSFRGNMSIISEKLEPIKDLFPGGKVPPPQMQGDYWVAWIEEKRGFVRFKKIYMPAIRTPSATLQFDVENANVPITVTANGRSISGTKKILLDVGSDVEVNWDIERGRVRSHMQIRRNIPPNIALGAFTIPALPISLIYEPPPDKAMKSHVKYSTTKYIGTTTEVSFGTEKSGTRPVKPQGYRKTTEMQSDLKTAASIISTAATRIPIPYASQAVNALNFIADGLGKITATETRGYAEARGTSLTLKYSQSEKFDTSPNDGGPGFGDVIVYLKNVKFLWFVNENILKLTMLGCDGNMPKLIGVDFLRKNLGDINKTGLDYGVGKALLDLDPFLLTKSIKPLHDRYRFVGEVDQRGTGLEYSIRFETEFSQEDWRLNKGFTTRVEDYRKGWLSFLGIGVTEDETVKFTSWSENISKTIRVEKAEVDLVFFASNDEIYNVAVYYDRIFSTFAFESVPPSQTAMLSGRVTGSGGKPLSGKMVKLVIDGKPIVTVADKDGHFKFYSQRIRPGKASLVVDNKVLQEINLSAGISISGIKLQLE